MSKNQSKFEGDSVAAQVRRGLAALARTQKNADHIRPAGPDTIYVDIKRIPSREDQPNRYQATAVAGLPSDTTLTAHGTSPEEALFEMRHQLLDVFWNTRLPGDTWADTRRRAATAKLEIFAIHDSI